MIHDAADVPAGTRIETGLCIIGAGAAGLTIARALRDRGVEVCLLESGGFTRELETQQLSTGRSVGHPYPDLRQVRTRAVGGSTHCWAGLCRPLDAADFEKRAWVPDSGWPFGLDTLRPYYERAQGELGLGKRGYQPAEWTREDSPSLPFGAAGEVPLDQSVIQLSGPLRMSLRDREWLATSEDVAVWTHANVTNIELAANGQAVDHLAVRSLEGHAFEVRASCYVLAAGGIENPRLLLASRSVREHGVGNEHDLVGRFFMEHPHVDMASLVLPTRPLPSLLFYKSHAVDDEEVVGVLHPPLETLRREQILNFITMLLPAPPGSEHAPLLHQVFDAGSDSDLLAHPDWPRRRDPRLIALSSMTEQAPNASSRVRLGEERDELGIPRVELDWQLQPIDKRTLLRAHELVGRSFGAAGLGRIRLELSKDETTWPAAMRGGLHHMGTTRMHDDPKQGVVDARGAVHGVANLYIAGSSLFPTGGASNPTLTIVALALRLAEHLAARLTR